MENLRSHATKMELQHYQTSGMLTGHGEAMLRGIEMSQLQQTKLQFNYLNYLFFLQKLQAPKSAPRGKNMANQDTKLMDSTLHNIIKGHVSLHGPTHQITIPSRHRCGHYGRLKNRIPYCGVLLIPNRFCTICA